MGTRKATTFLLQGILCSLLTLLIFQSGLASPYSGWTYASKGLSALLFLYTVACFHMSVLNPADSHSIRSALSFYIFRCIVSTLSRICVKRAEKKLKNSKQLQDSVLLQILSKASKTAYGLDYKLGEIKNREDFVKSHSLTEYSHYEHYIERVLRGEKNVVTPDEVKFIAMTSGTTGKNKKFPVTSSFMLDMMETGGAGLFVRKDVMFGDLGRWVTVRMKPTILTAPCGIQMSSISHYFSPLPSSGTTPVCCYDIGCEETAMYVHALFALAEPEVSVLDLLISPVGYTFFTTLFGNRDALCRDLQKGRIGDELEISEDTKEGINVALKANPDRAAFVKGELDKGTSRLAKRLWPGLQFVAMSCTGSFQHYAKIQQDTFLKGVPCGTPGLLASEGNVGCVVDAGKPEQYRLTPSDIFFEFILEQDAGQTNPPTFFIDQLTTGSSYEIVLTNRYGLYRYRLGDVITVVDYYHTCPLYLYKCRLGQLLNVAIEKTPENLFYESITKTEAELIGVKLVDYTATESSVIQSIGVGHEDLSKHYLLFVEVIKDSSEHQLLSEEEKALFDKNLQEKHITYGRCRKKGVIGPMEVIQVKNGTFKQVYSILKKDFRTQQFKMPRALRKPEALKFLLKARCC